MATYPSSIASFRSLLNKIGIVYDALKTRIFFAEDANNMAAEIVAIETELGTNPKGAKADVKTRLNDVDTAISNINQFSDEKAQDAVGGILDDGSIAEIEFNYNDSTPLISGRIRLQSDIASDHAYRGPVTNFNTANETINFGQVCFLNSSGLAQRADADAVATAFAWLLALDSVSGGETCAFALPGCFVRDNSWNWASLGQPIYLSTDTGELTQTPPSGADDVIQIIGIAVTADSMFFYPQLVQVEHT